MTRTFVNSFANSDSITSPAILIVGRTIIPQSGTINENFIYIPTTDRGHETQQALLNCRNQSISAARLLSPSLLIPLYKPMISLRCWNKMPINVVFISQGSYTGVVTMLRGHQSEDRWMIANVTEWGGWMGYFGVLTSLWQYKSNAFTTIYHNSYYSNLGDSAVCQWRVPMCCSQQQLSGDHASTQGRSQDFR